MLRLQLGGLLGGLTRDLGLLGVFGIRLRLDLGGCGLRGVERVLRTGELQVGLVFRGAQRRELAVELVFECMQLVESGDVSALHGAQVLGHAEEIGEGTGVEEHGEGAAVGRMAFVQLARCQGGAVLRLRHELLLNAKDVVGGRSHLLVELGGAGRGIGVGAGGTGDLFLQGGELVARRRRCGQCGLRRARERGYAGAQGECRREPSDAGDPPSVRTNPSHGGTCHVTTAFSR